MAKTSKNLPVLQDKPGPRDKDYVNNTESYEVDYKSKRKTPAKNSGVNRPEFLTDSV